MFIRASLSDQITRDLQKVVWNGLWKPTHINIWSEVHYGLGLNFKEIVRTIQDRVESPSLDMFTRDHIYTYRFPN